MGLAYALSISVLAFLGLWELKKWQKRQTVSEKLRLVTEALEHAEESLGRFQERHDRILYHISSQLYFRNRDLDEALAGARKAMDEALQHSVTLRQLQVAVVSSYL